MTSFLKQRILVFLFPLFLALPFLNRAYFVDDSYFVEIAEWLTENPTLPYHFRTDDAGIQTRGWEEDGFVRMVNPLGHHYTLALLLKLGGEREWFLRLGCVLLTSLSGLFLWGLARRWTKDPLWSTLLVFVTPAYALTSHSLLIDGTMAFFFLGGLYFFIKAAERDNIIFYLLSGVFMGCSILTKYPALFIVPLTMTYVALNWKKIKTKGLVILPWILALGALGWYSLVTAQIYGEPHILAASKRMVNVFGWAKYVVFFVFFSGVSLTPLVSWFSMSHKKQIVAGLFIFIAAVFFSSKIGGFSFFQGFLLGFWIVSSFLFFLHIKKSRRKFVYPRDPFLVFWILGFVAMMFVVMGWVAARYYLIVLPAVVFLTVRLIEIQWPRKSPFILKAAFSGMLLFALMLGYADKKQAAPSKEVGSVLKQKGYPGGEGRYYMGDSFTMAYLRDEGWIPWFPGTPFKVGDQILTKTVTMPPIWLWNKGIQLKPLELIEYPTVFPLKVMDYQGAAGFYASVWGALPYTVSTGPWERFHLFEVVGVE